MIRFAPINELRNNDTLLLAKLAYGNKTNVELSRNHGTDGRTAITLRTRIKQSKGVKTNKLNNEQLNFLNAIVNDNNFSMSGSNAE